MINTNKEKTVCFSAHRTELLDISKRIIKAELKNAIEDAIKKGFDTFLSGMSYGFDEWAAEIVLKMKKKNKAIKLICILPFADFGLSCNPFRNRKRMKILKNADAVHFISIILTTHCIADRDRFMVDHSSHIIVAYKVLNGSTKNILNYVKDKNVQIRNILKKEL